MALRGRVVVCISAIVAIHHMEWFYPVIARYLPEPTGRWPVPLRVYEPTARMRGHQVLARAVQERVEALKARGESPFVLTPTYGLASTLSFYLPGQPETYCLSWNFGMTAKPVNQHDLWHPNPRHDPDAFRDRAAIVVEDRNMPPSNAKHMVRKKVFGRLESLERSDRGRAGRGRRRLGHLDLSRLSWRGWLPAESPSMAIR